MKDSQYFENDRVDLISMIPVDAKSVLDVGCGFGLMGKALKERRDVRVVGVENSPKAVNVARDNVDHLVIGDAERTELPFEKGYFDCIVYGDVLEHFTDPWKVVKYHAHFLKDGGCCVASIPNISHYSVINGLLSDSWEYKPSGILDETHLRFFTIEGIRAMFTEAGYTVTDARRYIRGSKVKKFLNVLCGRRFDHLLTEQYLVRSLFKGK